MKKAFLSLVFTILPILTFAQDKGLDQQFNEALSQLQMLGGESFSTL